MGVNLVAEGGPRGSKGVPKGPLGPWEPYLNRSPIGPMEKPLAPRKSREEFYRFHWTNLHFGRLGDFFEKSIYGPRMGPPWVPHGPPMGPHGGIDVLFGLFNVEC